MKLPYLLLLAAFRCWAWGDGSFAAERRFPTGGNPLSIAVGDFNGDGKRPKTTYQPGLFAPEALQLLSESPNQLPYPLSFASLSSLPLLSLLLPSLRFCVVKPKALA